MPMSIGERWIFETLDAHGVKPSDIHLQKSRKKPLRFAFVGFGSAPAATKAISVLDGMSVAGVKLSTSRFYDTRTRSARPRISREDLIDRRYIGSKAQSELASFERQRGLAFLHLAPSTTEEGVRKLLCRHVPAVKVGFIDVSHGGPNPTTYADLADDESCRKAILECDGAVVDGHAIRVSWLERKNVWRPPRNAALFRSPPRRLVSSASSSLSLLLVFSTLQLLTPRWTQSASLRRRLALTTPGRPRPRPRFDPPRRISLSSRAHLALPPTSATPTACAQSASRPTSSTPSSSFGTRSSALSSPRTTHSSSSAAWTSRSTSAASRRRTHDWHCRATSSHRRSPTTRRARRGTRRSSRRRRASRGTTTRCVSLSLLLLSASRRRR